MYGKFDKNKFYELSSLLYFLITLFICILFKTIVVLSSKLL